MRPLTRTLAVLLSFLFVAPSTLIGQTAQKQTARNGRRSTPATSYAAQLKTFDAFVARQMALDQTPGVSVGFIHNDFIWVKGYGYSDLENKVPAKAESAYRLASVTKPMTAVDILQLAEKGKIDLDAEVQTYVPYFPKKPWPVTVRQVLGHLGGISHYKNPEQELHIKTPKTTREAIAIFENFDLVAEPGTRYSYSSYGYNLLGAVIESASGMSYGQYMRENVWLPLGMTDTRMDDPLEVIPNRVRGYQLIDGKVKNSEFIDISSRFAAGGTRSTVPDLLKFARGIMDGKLISAASMNAMSSSMNTKAGRLTNYGLGWETSPENGRFLLGHSGGQQETRTLLYILPAHKMAFAVAINFEGGNPGAYLERLFQLITGMPFTLNAYSADRLKRAYLEAINATFNYGLSYFEHEQQPLTANQTELIEAFTYFNSNVSQDVLSANPAEALRKIREGVHPISKQAFTRVGSYMAQQLRSKKGAAAMDTYAKRGALPFFQDYIALMQNNADIPKELRFSDAFSSTVNAMASDWNKSNTEFVRQLWLLPDDDVNVVRRELKSSFAGVQVYPNVLDDFFNVTRQFALKGDHANALKWSQLAVELYPEAPMSNFLVGFSYIINGDSTRGRAALKKTLSIEPNGPASAGSLNNVAYQLGGVGRTDDAIAILKAAIELHPKEANLHDSLGEFQLKKGDKAKALESYKKALELNPNFGNAEKAREIVKQLSAGQ